MYDGILVSFFDILGCLSYLLLQWMFLGEQESRLILFDVTGVIDGAIVFLSREGLALIR